jgi:hypothetical protein
MAARLTAQLPIKSCRDLHRRHLRLRFYTGGHFEGFEQPQLSINIELYELRYSFASFCQGVTILYHIFRATDHLKSFIERCLLLHQVCTRVKCWLDVAADPLKCFSCNQGADKAARYGTRLCSCRLRAGLQFIIGYPRMSTCTSYACQHRSRQPRFSTL